MLWLSADHHFLHKNIIKYVNRPYVTAEEMDEDLIEHWNQRVAANDQVYYLGDFGLGPKERLTSIFKRLNGKKILIKGNHDKSDASMMEIGFIEVHKYMEWRLDRLNVFLSHRPMYSNYHDVILCGHVHDLFKINGNIVNVGVDVWDYSPVSWEQIKDLKLDRSLFQRVHNMNLGEQDG